MGPAEVEAGGKAGLDQDRVCLEVCSGGGKGKGDEEAEAEDETVRPPPRSQAQDKVSLTQAHPSPFVTGDSADDLGAVPAFREL